MTTKSSCICPALLPKCHLVTHLCHTGTILKVRYNKPFPQQCHQSNNYCYKMLVISPVVIYKKHILEASLYGYSLKIVCWERMNELLDSFLSTDNSGCLLQVTQSSPTPQICSHLEESYLIGSAVGAFLMPAHLHESLFCLGAKVSLFL